MPTRHSSSPLALACCAFLAGCTFSKLGHEGDPGIFRCEDDPEEVWLLGAPAPGLLVVEVDTVAPDTTFDPEARIVRFDQVPTDADQIDRGESLDRADDEFECTFPPSSSECPRAEAELVDASPIAIGVSSTSTCDGVFAAYVVTATLDGDPMVLTFLGKDYY